MGGNTTKLYIFLVFILLCHGGGTFFHFGENLLQLLLPRNGRTMFGNLHTLEIKKPCCWAKRCLGAYQLITFMFSKDADFAVVLTHGVSTICTSPTSGGENSTPNVNFSSEKYFSNA